MSSTDKRPVQCPTGASATPLVDGNILCMGPTGVVSTECPDGYQRYSGFETSVTECRKATPASCPSGSSLIQLLTSPTEGKQVCMSSSVQTYTRPLPTSQDAPWPCDNGDPASVEPPSTVRCYRVSGAPSQSQSQAQPPSGTFDELNATYKQQVKEYEDAMMAAIETNAPSRLPEIRSKSEAIQATLAKMVESLTFMKKETNDVRVQRDKLLEDLRRIQKDYSAMLVNTDDLETLRRIRQQESGEARRQLNLYLLAFLFVAMALLVYIVFKGRKEDTTNASTPTPTMSPALM